jgi:hypothetical protein
MRDLLRAARKVSHRRRSYSPIFFNKRLTAEERHELVGIVEEIARIDGPTAVQLADVDVLKRRLGLATAG